jgi:hypothetical protein
MAFFKLLQGHFSHQGSIPSGTISRKADILGNVYFHGMDSDCLTVSERDCFKNPDHYERMKSEIKINAVFSSNIEKMPVIIEIDHLPFSVQELEKILNHVINDEQIQ